MVHWWKPLHLQYLAITIVDHRCRQRARNGDLRDYRFKHGCSWFIAIFPDLDASPQVYSGRWKERPVVIKCGLRENPKVDGGVPDAAGLPGGPGGPETSLFDKPTRGTSMDEFRGMLHAFFKVFLLLLLLLLLLFFFSESESALLPSFYKQGTCICEIGA